MEARLVEIELKLLGLEHTVQSLNEQVYAQRRQIDELRTLCRLLLQRQEAYDSGGTAPAPADERPPHY